MPFNRIKYEKFLRLAGFEKSTCYTETTRLLNAEEILMKFGMDLDSAVSNHASAGKALDLIEANSGKGAVSHNQKALKLYYFFRNKIWYDNYKPRKLKQKQESWKRLWQRREPDFKVQKIHGYSTNDSGPHISYARSVSDYKKIPGLVDFLESVYSELPGIVREIVGEVGGAAAEEFRQIPVFLCDEYPTEEYENSIDNVREKIIIRIGSGTPLTSDEVNRFFDEIKWSEPVFGSYFHEDPMAECEEEGSRYIKLYYRNAEYSDEEQYKAAISNCLAHEFFHYVHHVIAGEEFLYPFEGATVVKEAVADFGAEMVSLKWYKMKQTPEILALAEDSYNLWCSRYGSTWPYAHALDFYRFYPGKHSFFTDFDDYVDLGFDKKFQRVLSESCRGLDKAREILSY